MTKHHEPKEGKPITPSENDWRALEFIDVSRVARTGQIERATGLGRDWTEERLRAYFDKPLLWVTKFKEHGSNRGGSTEDVYALTTKGASALKRARGFRLGPTNLDKRNAAMLDKWGKIKGNYEHQLAIAEVAARFHAGCRATGGNVTFIDQADVFRLLPEETQRKSKPFGWQVMTPRCFPTPDEEDEYYDDEWRQGVVPDRVMGLDLRYKGKKTWFLFELYRNMSLFKRDLVTQKSVMLKLLSLVRTRERQQTEYFFTNHFGLSAFRGVIVLKPDAQYKEEINVDNLLRYIETYLEPEPYFAPNMFLLADWQDVHADNILLTPWRNGRGEIVQLIE